MLTVLKGIAALLFLIGIAFHAQWAWKGVAVFAALAVAAFFVKLFRPAN